MRVELTDVWTPTQAEFDAFARLSGDDNPIHVDPRFAAATAFGRTVSHGMLIYSMLWGLLRRACPDARLAGQDMMFPNPAYADETLKLEIFGVAPGMLTMRAARLRCGTEVFRGKAELAS